MDKRAAVFLSLATAVLSSGCAEPDGEPADQTTATAEAAPQSAPEPSPFLEEARLAVDELAIKVHALGLRYADAAGATADEWDTTQRSVLEVRRRVETDLARAETTGADALEEVRGDLIEGLQTFTERVDRARLQAAEDAQAFVVASESDLVEIDRRIGTLRLEATQLGEEARAEAASEVETLQTKADEIGEAIATLSVATEEEISETREELAHSIAALAGSVQRKRLEIAGAGA